jgi:peptidoglycan/xylan/chitin deacetylase (PgdA/CDA1 family)
MRLIAPAAAALAAATWLGPGAAAHCPPLARALRVPLRLDGRAQGVALTFDDGPHPQGTPAVLEALARAGARATFFLVGEQAERHPQLVGELLAAGHEAAVHGYRHRCQLRLTAAAVRADVERALEVLGGLCGRAPRCYRPPYGAFTLAGLRAVRRAALEPLLWSRWGRDWRAGTGAPEIARLATSKLRAGDVVLLHDADTYCDPRSWRHTVAALPAILAALEERGLAAITVSEGADS